MTLSIRLLPLLLVSLAGCGKICPWSGCDDTDDTGEPDPPIEKVVIDSSILRWNMAASDSPSEPKIVRITNAGNVRVNLTDLQNVDNPAFEVDDEHGAFPGLDPDEFLDLSIVFNPQTGGDFRGQLLAGRTARTGGVVDLPPIELVGLANGPSPSISAPALGDVVQWCSDTLTVEVRNAGPDSMPIEDVSLGGEADCDDFMLDTEDVADFLATPIPKDGLATLRAYFTPSRPRPHACPLTIDTALPRPVEATLRGTGVNTTEARETWYTSDGSGAHVLVIHDDGASNVAGHHDRLDASLDNMARALNTEGVDYRVAAPSTDSGCTEPGDKFAVASDGESAAVDVLRRNLFATGNALANEPFRLISDAVGPSSKPCFGDWLQAPDPVHVLVVSARDDASRPTQSVASWIGAIRAEYGPVTVSAIVPTTGCAPSAPRLEQAATDTGGRTYDLCATEWSGFWPAFAAQTASLRQPRSDHRLLGVPLPGSLRVALDGVATTEFRLDRRYDTSGETTIELPSDVVLLVAPADGTRVDALYADRGTCL